MVVSTRRRILGVIYRELGLDPDHGQLLNLDVSPVNGVRAISPKISYGYLGQSGILLVSLIRGQQGCYCLRLHLFLGEIFQNADLASS
jgi:hypothetical protein